MKRTAYGSPKATSASGAAAAAAAFESDFARDRKNRVACLSLLCKQAQRIERVWDADPELRAALLAAYSRCLAALAGHKDKACAELSSLAPKVSPTVSLRHFLTMALPVERQHTRGLRDHEFLVLRPDDPARADAATAPAAPAAAAPARSRMPLSLVLDNLRSAFNVGSIFRTSECLRLHELVLCGYTATPADTQTGKAAMGADLLVPHRNVEKTVEAVRGLKAGGVPVYALETVEGAPSMHEFKFPSPCALLVGNERHGVEADVLAECDGCVRIPVHGVKNSLNVGVAFAITAYEVARQWAWDGGAALPGADGAAAADST